MNRRIFCTLFPILGGAFSFFRDGTFEKHVKPILENPRRLKVLRPRMPLEEVFEGVQWEQDGDVQFGGFAYRSVEVWLPEDLDIRHGTDFYGAVILRQTCFIGIDNIKFLGPVNCIRTPSSLKREKLPVVEFV